MKRPTPNSPSGTPGLQTRVGPNWKLIRNLFIIAGLLFAISAAWENLNRAKAKRHLEHQQAEAKRAEDREKAHEDAKKRAAELAERARQQAAETTRATITPPTITPPTIMPRQVAPAEALARLRAALASGDRSELPPGTLHHGSCDYFLVMEPMTWPEAADFAVRHGGLLAIPNVDANLSWLHENVSQGEAIWIGASRNDAGKWKLTDGRNWAPATELRGNGPYLAVDGRGLLGTLGTSARLAFVIQWGTPPKPKSPTAVETSAPSPEEIALTNRARELIVAAERKRAEQLAENARIMAWDLDVWLRGLPKGDQAGWLPHINRLKTAASNGRVPTSIPESSGIKLSQKMADIARYAATKQSQIDSGFISETGKIHRAYLAKIQEAINEATASGKPALAKSLGKTIESAGTRDVWLKSLGVDSATLNPGQ